MNIARDDFAGLPIQSWQAPYSTVFAISGDADNDLPNVTRAIRATGAGTVVVVTNNDWLTWKNGGMAGAPNTTALEFADGELRNIRVARVLTTGTTATGLEGLL